MTPLLGPRPRADRSFERMYRRHVSDVYRYTLVLLRNPDDAEDVTQTTFLNAYRAYSRGERPRAPRSWLIAIAHNVCRQRFRQAARRPREVALDEDQATAIVPHGEGPNAEEIRSALDHLAFNQRAALVMRELEGRSYAEIAEVLELTVPAVETLIFRARRALREQLEGTFTCHEAELAVSKQLDGRLARGDRGMLRAHLRECEECETFARSARAQRSAWKALSLAPIPLPSSLASFFSGAGAGSAATAAGTGIGTGIAAKAAAVVAATAVAGGVGYEGARHAHLLPSDKPAVAAVPSPVPPSPDAPTAAGTSESPAVAVSKPDNTDREKPATAERQAAKAGKADRAEHAKPERSLEADSEERGKALGHTKERTRPARAKQAKAKRNERVRAAIAAQRKAQKPKRSQSERRQPAQPPAAQERRKPKPEPELPPVVPPVPPLPTLTLAEPPRPRANG